MAVSIPSPEHGKQPSEVRCAAENDGSPIRRRVISQKMEVLVVAPITIEVRPTSVRSCHIPRWPLYVHQALVHPLE